jgi:hypothetical protein
MYKNAIIGWLYGYSQSTCLYVVFYTFLQLLYQPAVSFRPGQHITMSGIGAPAFATGKIMNARPGTDLVKRGSEIIPCTVIDVPMQAGAGKTLLL